MKLLVRADDLGYSEAINFGLAKAVREGFVNNVGLMVNMPAAEHGVVLLTDVDVVIGCHINICLGPSIVDAKRIPSLTNSAGSFKSSKEYRNAKEDFVVLDEGLLEIEAQVQRFIELTGKKPHYIDGHAVYSPTFAKGLRMIAEKYQVTYSGFPQEGYPLLVNDTKVYLSMDSMEEGYDPYESLKKIVENPHQGGVDMMVLHPGYLDDFVLQTSSLTIPRTKEVEMACDKHFQIWLTENKVQFVTYLDL